MALHNFVFFVALSKIFVFVVSLKNCSAIKLHNQVKYVVRSFILSSEHHILYDLFSQGKPDDFSNFINTNYDIFV